MAQTKLNFAIKESTSDVPTTGGEIVQSSATEEQTAGTNNDTNTSKTTGSANTGLFTSEVNVSASASSFSQEPLVFGSLLFVGIVIFFAFLVKLKTRKQLGFKKSMVSSRHTTTILGFLSLLMIFAGVGGVASKYIGSSATAGELDDIMTKGEVNAKLIETGDDYKLYCGVDEITPNAKSDYGYYLFMYADNNGYEDAMGGTLKSDLNQTKIIESSQDWGDLKIGEWGFFVGEQNNQTYNPMPIGISVIDSENGKTGVEPVLVTYCAKLDKDIKEANYSTNIYYDVLVKEGTDPFDFNSTDDDDSDGLSNREENRYGMNPYSIDSDLDSVNDYDELKVYFTDPLAFDTDEDGLSDYSEIALSETYNTDPLEPYSCSHRDCVSDKLDGEQTYTYSDPEGEVNGISFTVTGTGDIPLTYISTAEPKNIDESFDSISGKAYIFGSYGDVSNASIEVPLISNTANSDDSDDELLGAIVIEDDGTITKDDLYAKAISFEDDSENDNEVEANIQDIKNDVSVEGNNISINFGSGTSVIMVGEDTATNGFDEMVGATKITKTKTKTTTTSSSISLKGILSGVISSAKSFFDAIKKSVCKLRKGTWDSSKGKCITKGGNIPIATWSTKFNVDANSSDTDRFKYILNYPSRQEGKRKGQNQCYGIALLTRLLYKGKIDTSKTHTVTTKDGETYTFNLGGYDKRKILDTGVDSNKNPVDDKVEKAIHALYQSQASENAIKESKPNTILKNFKAIESNDDPVLVGISQALIGEHAVNLISLEDLGSNNYNLIVYDNNFLNVQTWKMNCTIASCNITGVDHPTRTDVQVANFLGYYLRQKNDDYYK